jgi:hypothetical protein
MIIGVSGTAALANPTTGPTLTPGTGGSLVPGAYDVVYTKVNTFGETLPSSPTTITLTSGQTRITPSAITGLPSGVNVNWYITDPNLAVLKLHSTNNGASFNINSVSGTGPATPPTINTTASADHGEKGFITGSNGIARTITPGGVDFALGLTGDYSVVGGVGTVTHVQGILYDTVDPTNGQAYLYNSTAGKDGCKRCSYYPGHYHHRGHARLSVVPVDAAHPVVVGTNDPIVGKVRHGTSFPTSPAPATNDQFLRDDQNKLYRYNGSSWDDLSAGGADASTTVKGISKLSTAPTSSTNPIAVGDNDSRMTDARTPIGTALTSGNIVLGNGSNAAAAVAVSGDISLSNAGVVAVNKVKGINVTNTPSASGKALMSDSTTDASWQTPPGGSAAAVAHGSSFPGTPTTNDQFIRDDLNTLSRYDGAAWQTIGGSGGSGTFVGCSVYHTGSQSFSNSTITEIAFNAERFDTDAFHDNSTNNTRLTIPTGKGGKYIVSFSVRVDAGSTGGINIRFRKNGSTNVVIHNLVTSDAGGARFSSMSSQVLDLVATDYIEVVIQNASGGSASIDNTSSGTGDYSPEFSLYKVG